MKAYLLEVSGRRIKAAMPIQNPRHLRDDLMYNVCSECSSLIIDTWDHTKRCSLYKNEPLAQWVQMGIKEQG